VCVSGGRGGDFDQKGLNQIILSSFRSNAAEKLNVLLEHTLTDAMQASEFVVAAAAAVLPSLPVVCVCLRSLRLAAG
jgi:hypothetical protein